MQPRRTNMGKYMELENNATNEYLDNKIKVLQFCDNYYPQIDGVIKVVDNSTRIMNERHSAKVVVPKYKGKDFDDSVFSYDVLRRNTNSVMFNGIEIPLPKKTNDVTSLIKNYNADIYHIHSPFFVGRYALKLAKENKVPVIGTFHSQFKKDILSVTHSKMLADVLVKNIVSVFNQCTEVWAPSISTANVLRSYGYEKEIFIMENGTDFTYPDNINETVKRVKQQYGIQDCHKNLLFVGQIRDVKNISLILETLKGLLNVDQSYHLYLVGEGSDRAKYEKWIADKGIQTNVHFLGKITDKTVLAGIYAACDLFFFPSTYDNAPIVVRESCVMRTPVLLPLGAVAAEPFLDGVNGYLAEENAEKMKDKIVKIFQSPEEMRKIGERAAKEIPISYQKMVDKTLERYEVVIRRFRGEK